MPKSYNTDFVLAFFRQAHGGIAPETEYRFAPPRKFRFDFAWPSYKISLEVEGGIYLSVHGGKSRHFYGTGAVKDMEKYNLAASKGWRVFKCQPKELLTTKTADMIWAAIRGDEG